MNKQDRDAQARLIRLGIDPDDAYQLHLIERRLHRWYELECGTDRGAIEQDEETGKWYWYNPDTVTRETRQSCPIRDGEKSALKKLAATMAKYPAFVEYVHGDPRGGTLYIIPRDQLRDGVELDCYYSSVGVCV